MKSGSMHILVINSGSSSVKFSIFSAISGHDPEPVVDGSVSGIGTADATLEIRHVGVPRVNPVKVGAKNSLEAIRLVLDEVSKPEIPHLDAIGYRVVHPGPKLNRHQRITDIVLADLEAAVVFAPLHDPDAIHLIREAMHRFPDIPHYACFDTIFHQTMPASATTYPIPARFRAQGVRRYGFHGLSCESGVRQLDAAAIRPERMVIAHLGSGCSVTALRDGKSVDTTMGLTPTGGVVMGTRPGDLDPGLIFYLLREDGATVDSVEHMLNHEAGIKALFGVNDMQKLRDAAATGDERAKLAAEIFTSSVRRAIGGMAALHGLDALVFTGGIGEHDAVSREEIAGGLWQSQPIVDPILNTSPGNGIRKISSDASATPVYIVPAEEDWMIAIHVSQMAASASANGRI